MTTRQKSEARKNQNPRTLPVEKQKEKRTLALQLVDLGLAEALDERELLLAGVRERLDRVDAALEQLLEVGRGDALCLCRFFGGGSSRFGGFESVAGLMRERFGGGVVVVDEKRQAGARASPVRIKGACLAESLRVPWSRHAPLENKQRLGSFAAGGSARSASTEKKRGGGGGGRASTAPPQPTCSAERGIGPPASPSAAASSMFSCCSWATGASSMASIFSRGRAEEEEEREKGGGGLRGSRGERLSISVCFDQADA